MFRTHSPCRIRKIRERLAWPTHMFHGENFGVNSAPENQQRGKSPVALVVLRVVLFHTDLAACYQKSYHGGRDGGVFIAVSTLYAENGLGR